MVVLINMAMKKIMISLPAEMVIVLEKDRKERYLETIPETIRVILSEYVRRKLHPNGEVQEKNEAC